MSSLAFCKTVTYSCRILASSYDVGRAMFILETIRKIASHKLANEINRYKANLKTGDWPSLEVTESYRRKISILALNTRNAINHYSDVIMSAMVSRITGVSIVYSIFFFGCRSKKISKLRVAGLCVGNSQVTGVFSAQKASNAGNFSIW